MAAAIRPNTRLISVNFPHNPDGMIISQEDLSALVALCRKHGLYLFSDEVFRGVELNDEDRIPQIADIYEKGISLGVMSKAYGLPGLRIGWLASRDTEALAAVEKYKQYLSIANSVPRERLTLIALKARDRILENNRESLRKNVVELEQMRFSFPGLFEWQRPQGACIAYPKFIGPGGGEAFCQSLIEERGVLLLPASIYASPLVETPKDHFRIGFGRKQVFQEGLKVMREHIEAKYPEFVH